MTNEQNPEIRLVYILRGSPGLNCKRITIYSDGKVNLTDCKTSEEKKIAPEKVEEACKALTEEGFFELKDEYTVEGIRDGHYDTVFMSYNGRSKKIGFDNAEPPDSAKHLRNFMMQSADLLSLLFE